MDHHQLRHAARVCRRLTRHFSHQEKGLSTYTANAGPHCVFCDDRALTHIRHKKPGDGTLATELQRNSNYMPMRCDGLRHSNKPRQAAWLRW